MKTFLIVPALVLVLAVACQNVSKTEPAAIAMSLAPEKAEEAALQHLSTATDSIASATPPPPPDQSPDQQPDKKQLPAGSTPSSARPDWNKKIIRNASLELEIKDFKEFERLVNAIAGKYGGYIAEESQESSDYKIQSSVSIRVPVDQFGLAVNELTGRAEKILSKNITSKDVTGEVVDIRSRLEAKRQARLRYLELMKQAKNMEEVFLVQKEVDGIQEEIEAAAGRVSYLGHAAAYSTIQLVYFQVLDPEMLNNHNRQPSFGGRVLEAFGEGFQWLGDLLVTLITLWPMVLGLGLLVYALRKTWRRNRAKSTAGAVAGQTKV